MIKSFSSHLHFYIRSNFGIWRLSSKLFCEVGQQNLHLEKPKLGHYTKNVDEKKNVEAQDNNDSKGILKEDRVELSSIAKKILEAKKIVDSVADIREQKIADIKMQIENRTYQFNENKMASGLLKESLLNDLL